MAIAFVRGQKSYKKLMLLSMTTLTIILVAATIVNSFPVPEFPVGLTILLSVIPIINIFALYSDQGEY